MTKLLLGLLGAVVIGTGGYAAAAGLDDAEPARTVSLPGGATTSGDTGATTGTTTAATTAATTVETTDDDIVVGITPGAAGNTVDVSGPCDEAEHDGDPRCTGVGGDDDDDRSGSNSGRGSGDDHGDDPDDDHDDDHNDDDD